MSAITHVKLLVNLARIDGEVDQKELSYVVSIAKANGISHADVALLIGQDHEVIIPASLTDEQRFEYIFSLVQLMKIDERLFENEIRYCSKVASKLGYDQGVMFDLMLNVKSIAMEKNDIENLRKATIKHLRED
jgi:uncharacterized tellurite resistance protein B-like protein